VPATLKSWQKRADELKKSLATTAVPESDKKLKASLEFDALFDDLSQTNFNFLGQLNQLDKHYLQHKQIFSYDYLGKRFPTQESCESYLDWLDGVLVAHPSIQVIARIHTVLTGYNETF
jgi:hypothetical protein